MRQVMFSYNSPLKTIDAPIPALKPGFLLVRNHYSAISIGTERVSTRFGHMNLFQKAMEKPDKIRQVLQSVSQNGFKKTIQQVNKVFEKWNSSGYSCSGIIEAIGSNVSEFQIGDRVACGGGGYAVHAEFCCAPKNLVVRVPDSVSDEDAAFAAIGSVAMHGFRIGGIHVCERVAVIGLGIIGQLLCQIAASAGADVIALDVNRSRVEFALKLGIKSGVTMGSGTELAEVSQLTSNRGVDAVFICAATSSSEPVNFSSKILRDRGKIIIVGDVGMLFDRQLLFEKELEIKVSRSYGPGRYDRSYEEKGYDYPYGYVRWTEKRNMESFLDLIGKNSIKLSPLITHRYNISEAETAFRSLTSQGGDAPLGAVFKYDFPSTVNHNLTLKLRDSVPAKNESLKIGLIGPGTFANTFIMPSLAKHKISKVAIAGTTGLSALQLAEKYKFQYVTTDISQLIEDAEIGAVFISSRHDSHAELVVKALEAGKNVYVEKPLALSNEELIKICEAYNSCSGSVMVGFNRRFAPFSVKVKNFLSGIVPIVLVIRVNAGSIEKNHWSMLEDSGGGRIIGEACHFIDLMQFFAGSQISKVYAQAKREPLILEQDLGAIVNFKNGSVGILAYTAQGNTSYPKERIEIYAGGKVAVINDFRRLSLIKKGKIVRNKANQDKGIEDQVNAFLAHMTGQRACPIPFEESVNSTLATLALIESARSGLPVSVPEISINTNS